MQDFNFEEDLSINLDKLHEEWQNHSTTYFYYAKELSRQEKVVKKLHEKVKVTRSKLIKEGKASGAGTNQLMLEAYYRDHEDHINAKDEQIEAEYLRDMLLNAVFAFNHRRAALDGEVELWKRNYFVGPTEPLPTQPWRRFVEDRKKDEVVQTARAVLNRGRRTT